MSNSNLKRREFLKMIAGGSALGSLGSIGQLALMNQAAAAGPTTGYKALVCIFLLGGNDGFNMLIPSDASYADYEAIRAALAVQENDLDIGSISTSIKNGTLGGGAANPYNVDLSREKAYTKGFYDLASKGINLGVNAVMPEFAQLVMDDKLSIIANSGNMVAPVTKAQIQAKTADLPLFLFAHNHQQRALQTGQANNLDDIGWAGKIADAWQGINSSSPLGLNISYSGSNRMLIGQETSPLVLKPNNPPSFYKISTKNSFETSRRDLFKELLKIGKEGNAFHRLNTNLLDHSLDSFEALKTTWDANPIAYNSKGPYGESLFDIPSSEILGFQDNLKGKFITQMEAVAKMINLGANNAFHGGNNDTPYTRQVFFVGVGGFDTHADQISSHPALLRELSLGLWKFQTAMEELNLAENVTTFSMSDFGRTLSINGGLGTDHAWGSHHFVMGGAGNKNLGTLNGGNMIGILPVLQAGGTDDYSNKGRIIPTTSQDQVNATICKWFGVEESLISDTFPNLSNFETTAGNTSSAFLNDLFV